MADRIWGCQDSFLHYKQQSCDWGLDSLVLKLEAVGSSKTSITNDRSVQTNHPRITGCSTLPLREPQMSQIFGAGIPTEPWGMPTHFRLLLRLEISLATVQISTAHVIKACTGQNDVFAITFSFAMTSTGDLLDSHSCGFHVSTTLMTQRSLGVIGGNKEG